MKKTALFTKLKDNLYRFNGGNDPSFFTLFIFLGDGLYKETYFKFLHDAAEQVFYGNVSGMQKKDNQVTVFVYDDLIPDAIPFTTSIYNLITILKEWDRLRLEQVETITLTLNNEMLTMTGA